MTEFERQQPYPAPPIIEAVVQLEFAEPLGRSSFQKLRGRLERGYDNAVSMQLMGASLDLAKQKAEFIPETQIRLSSSDETDILIIHPSTLSWSRLPPYEGWNNFADRLQEDIKVAEWVGGKRKLTRVGVRFINRIDVPIENGISQYEDYLNINLSLPEAWEGINGYGWRFERFYPENSLVAIVQSATVQPQVPDHNAFLLDIDIVAQANLPARTTELFGLFTKMRHLKNEIFELSITDTARASFQK